MAGFSSNSQFDEAFKKKYEILQQNANTNTAEQLATAQLNTNRYGAGGVEDRNRLAQERMTAMQYGPGGQGDRTNTAQLTGQSMQYGPGGMGDRNNLALQPFRSAQTNKLTQDYAQEQLTNPYEVNKLARSDRFATSQEGNLTKMANYNVEKTGLELDQMRAELNPKVTAVAKPRRQPAWYTGRQVTPDEEFSNYDTQATGVGDWLKRRVFNIGNVLPRIGNSILASDWMR
jgi:hypothetical protein